METPLVCGPANSSPRINFREKFCEFCWLHRFESYAQPISDSDPEHWHLHHYGHFYRTFADTRLCWCGRKKNG